MWMCVIYTCSSCDFSCSISLFIPSFSFATSTSGSLASMRSDDSLIAAGVGGSCLSTLLLTFLTAGSFTCYRDTHTLKEVPTLVGGDGWYEPPLDTK